MRMNAIFGVHAQICYFVPMSKTDRHKHVALAVGYPSGFEDEIVRGAIDYAEYAGGWTFATQGHRPFMPIEDIDLTAVDGVIGLLTEPRWIDALVQADIAAVNASTRCEEALLARAGNDDPAIGRMAGEHMLKLGLRDYGYVARGHSWFAQRRLHGFVQVIEPVTGRRCQVFDGIDHGDQSYESALSLWLSQLPKPIGIMAENDSTALILIRVAVELGLRVPEDIAVLGVDNDRWATSLSPVPISSVQIDARRIGYQAARLLDRLMRQQPANEPIWVPPVGVATRTSTDITFQEDAAVVSALRFIRENCTAGIFVDNVCDHVGISRRSLEMRLKRAIGQSPQVAIYQAQIERAKPMLQHSSETMGEISRTCGFERQEQFSRLFKRYTGLTPSQYRQRRLTHDDPALPTTDHTRADSKPAH